MSKRLPYFQFEPAEYLAGDIMFCSYASQGMFISICALYWQKDCQLNYSQIVKRFGNEELISELTKEKIIKINGDAIIINFLDEQYSKATIKSNVNSENGKKGALKRWRNDSEIIATPLKNDSESIALREDKIKENKIIDIPDFDVFLLYAKEKEPSVLQTALKNKYDAWVANDWKDGNNRKISNWKTKLLHTMPFIEKQITKKYNTDELRERYPDL